MKKIIVLIPLSLLTLLGISQTSDSVTCLPNVQLRKAIKEIENCKILKEELALTSKSVSILRKIVVSKDSVISIYKINDSLQTRRYTNALLKEIDYKSQVVNYKKIGEIYKKDLDKEKNKKYYAAAIGLIVGFAIFH